jgi:hypothetical protein
MSNEYYEQGVKLAMDEFLATGKVAAAKKPKKLETKAPGAVAAQAARKMMTLGK